jgi:transcriptional regulator with XRE-family HTH domain
MAAIAKTLGKNVKELRLALDYTQEELSQYSGISPQHIAKIEAGDRFVSEDALVVLAKALEVEASELLRDQGKEPRGKSKAQARLMRLVGKMDDRESLLIHEISARILKELR